MGQIDFLPREWLDEWWDETGKVPAKKHELAQSVKPPVSYWPQKTHEDYHTQCFNERVNITSREENNWHNISQLKVDKPLHSPKKFLAVLIGDLVILEVFHDLIFAYA